MKPQRDTVQKAVATNSSGYTAREAANCIGIKEKLMWQILENIRSSRAQRCN